MAANNQTYITTVKINDEEAKNKLAELKKLAKDYQTAKVEALKQKDDKAVAELDKKIKEVNKDIQKMSLETMNVDKILDNLSDASLAQLQKTAKSLNHEIRNISPNSDVYKKIANDLKDVNSEIAKRRSEFKGQESWMARLADGMNRWQTAIVGAMGAITGLTMTIRKSVQDYADMEEAMANVRKYTGWTDEQIRDFNEDLKKMDTRTSREDLNALAGDAGRLGITSKEMVGEFVDAADKINVALGDDLGDDAVATVGKLAQTFGDSDKMGLRGAMLATGSAVNELAASSSASAGYVVDFTSRLAGVATQAGLSQTEIMGLAAVLDSNMQQCETSSTALSQLISKMYQEPAKFAKLAGADVEQFTSLLKTDANGALMQFLQTMQAKGGFDALAPMFQEMGLSGTRCVGVLSTLAMHLDEVKNQQDIASNAFKDGTSVLNEFNTQNNTVQAGIDKAQKAFHEVSVELGEKLQPVVKYTISSATLMTKGLLALIQTVTKFKTTIALATVALIAWNAAALEAMIMQKLSKVIGVCTTAVKALNTAIKANPWMLLASVMATVAGLLVDYVSNMRNAKKVTEEQTKAMERQQKATDAIGNSTGEAVSKFQLLQDQWKRLKTVAQQNQFIKDNSDLFKELGVNVRDAADAQKLFVQYSALAIKALSAEAEANAYADLYKEAVKERQKYLKSTKGGFVIDRVTKQNVTVEEAKAVGAETFKVDKNGGAPGAKADWQEMVKESSLTPKMLEEIRKRRANAAMKAVYADENYYKAYMDKANENAEALKADLRGKMGSGEVPSGSIGGTSSASGSSSSASSSQDNATKEALAKSKQLMAEEMAATEYSYGQGELLYSQYMQKKYDIQKAELEREKSNYEKGSADYNNVLIAEQKLDQSFNDYKTKAAISQLDQEEVYAKRYIELNVQDEEKKEESLFQIHQRYQQMRLAQLTPNTKEYEDLQTEIMNEQEAHRFELQKSWQEKAAAFKKQYIPQTAQETYDLEMKFADQLYAKGLLSKEEYEKAKAQIEKEYTEKQKQDVEDAIEDEKASMEGIGDGLQFDSLGKSLDNLLSKIKEGGAGWKDYAQLATAALTTVKSFISSISSYQQAANEAEIAQTEAKYDKLIEAAEGNDEEQERLEEEKTKKTNEIKAQGYKQERDANVATALINVALGITQGYAQYGPIIGSVLAALTTAMGAIEIATINKQYEAQVASLQSNGYYEGGYTGGKRYHEEAGVVHQGEFVANHEAVNNPTLSPVLDLIDQAQQNNTVGSLTSDDLRSAITGGNVQTVAPVVNVNTDNSDLKASMGEMSSAVKELNRQLDEGLHTNLSMTEFKRAEKHYNNLMNNK